MRILTIIVILILFTFLSCGTYGNKTTSAEELNKEGNKLENKQDLTNPGEFFAKSILEINLGIKRINFSESENLNYNQLFKKDGIVNIVAFYDKRTNQPNKFEDFLLFVASYEDSKSANSAFERIKSDAELSNSNENVRLDQKRSERIELLRLGDKYGGLITYNEKQVFSLVENCDKLPTNMSWLELEYKFTDLLKNRNGFVEVLKAGCEEGLYYGGRRNVR